VFLLQYSLLEVVCRITVVYRNNRLDNNRSCINPFIGEMDRAPGKLYAVVKCFLLDMKTLKEGSSAGCIFIIFPEKALRKRG